MIDVRPIFSRKRDDVVGQIIVPFLNIEYIDETRSPHSISLVMDEGDILKMVETLESAVSKIKRLREYYNEVARTRVIVVGEENLSDVL